MINAFYSGTFFLSLFACYDVDKRDLTATVMRGSKRNACIYSIPINISLPVG